MQEPQQSAAPVQQEQKQQQQQQPQQRQQEEQHDLYSSSQTFTPAVEPPQRRKIKLHLHPAAVVLIIFGLLSWAVAFLGLIFSTNYCVSTNVGGGGYCADLFQLEWYTVFFEIAILLAILITGCMDVFEKGRYIYLCYISMVTFLLSLMARNFITNSFKAGEISLQDLHATSYNAAAAGAIMCCIVNYLLIVFIGLGATTELPAMEGLKLKNIVRIPQRLGGRMGFGSLQQKYQVSSSEGF